MIKNISKQWKIPGQLCSFEQAQVAQNFWIIKNIYSVLWIQVPSVFQGKRKLFKTPECKKYIPYRENFQGNSVFQDKRKCSKILNDKKYFKTVKIPAQLCFTGQEQVAQNSCMVKNISKQWKIPGQLCSFEQAQVAQNFWIIKNIYLVLWIQVPSVFQGKRKLLKNPE